MSVRTDLALEEKELNPDCKNGVESEEEVKE